MLYDKPVRLLLADALAELPEPVRVPQIIAWFASRYPRVKENTVRMHVVAFTANDPSRRHHPAYRNHPPLLFRRHDGAFERYDDTRHGRWSSYGERAEGQQVAAEGRELDSHQLGVETASDVANAEFALEMYLEEFLLSNWDRIDWGRRLRLLGSDRVEGHQYSTPVGRIDFLCEDVDTGALVAVELKRGRPSDQVVGQLARYMGWLRREHATPGQHVEGLVVAHEVDQKLQYAAEAVPGVGLLEYRIRFDLVPADLGASHDAVVATETSSTGSTGGA